MTDVTDVTSGTGVTSGRGMAWPRPAEAEEWAGAAFTDDELTALALAADPEEPLGADAVALPLYPDEAFGALPAWYMPPAMARVAGGWRRVAIFAIIAGFLVIDAFGLCITYGQLVVA